MKTKPYVVLVGMDFSNHADRALAHAFELATRHEHAEVHVLCVIPSAGLGAHHALTGYCLTAEAGVRDGAFESLRAHVQVELDAFLARESPPRVPEQVVSHVRLDAPALGIAERAICSWARWPKIRFDTPPAQCWWFPLKSRTSASEWQHSRGVR